MPDDPFGPICYPRDLCTNGTQGVITWSNRTAQVNGTLWHNGGSGSSQVQMAAFAGSRQIGGIETRTIHAGEPRFSYHQGMGDPDLRGGINLVVIRFCSPRLDNCFDWFGYAK